ncbi:MAG TPA: CapA family protein [Vulgatibacter sp.]|nr:CapA family protein [Vulgatibacter sp.]
MTNPLRIPTPAILLALAACAAGIESRPIPCTPCEAPSPGPAPAAAPAREQPEILAVAKVAAVGDLLMHEAVKESARAADRRGEDGASLNNGGYDALFEGVADRLREADLAFANLETPLAPRTGRGSRAFVFNAPRELLPALRHAGIGIVSFANNHVYDQGRAGFVETLAELRSAGLPFVGAGDTCDEASSATFLEVNGIRLAFLGATRLFNQDLNRGRDEPCTFLLDEAEAKRRIAEARDQGADLVVLSIHWGVEYETAPRKQEIALAHRLVDAGADVILGHHPHVLQPVEIVQAADGRVGLVAYSLGNFVSNQSRTYVHGVHPAKMGNTRDGVILRFKAVRKRYPGGQVRVELADVLAEPLWTDNDALARVRAPSRPPRIRVVHVDGAIAEAREALAAEVAESTAVDLQRRIELLEARRAMAGQVLGDDLLPR